MGRRVGERPGWGGGGWGLTTSKANRMTPQLHTSAFRPSYFSPCRQQCPGYWGAQGTAGALAGSGSEGVGPGTGGLAAPWGAAGWGPTGVRSLPPWDPQSCTGSANSPGSPRGRRSGGTCGQGWRSAAGLRALPGPPPGVMVHRRALKEAPRVVARDAPMSLNLQAGFKEETKVGCWVSGVPKAVCPLSQAGPRGCPGERHVSRSQPHTQAGQGQDRTLPLLCREPCLPKTTRLCGAGRLRHLWGACLWGAHRFPFPQPSPCRASRGRGPRTRSWSPTGCRQPAETPCRSLRSGCCSSRPAGGFQVSDPCGWGGGR